MIISTVALVVSLATLLIVLSRNTNRDRETKVSIRRLDRIERVLRHFKLELPGGD